EEAKLLPADLGGGDEFGFPIALDGGDAVIGSGRDGDAAPSAGSA
ncbi:MAG: FG-GAP repeat protein, partial [Planctomycetes bacterium]|nr:FG-GAP repeat protein [Planctomycetota bacterium]